MVGRAEVGTSALLWRAYIIYYYALYYFPPPNFVFITSFRQRTRTSIIL